MTTPLDFNDPDTFAAAVDGGWLWSMGTPDMFDKATDMLAAGDLPLPTKYELPHDVAAVLADKMGLDGYEDVIARQNIETPDPYAPPSA